MLIEQNFISQAQLEEALASQKSSGRKIGRILIENGYVKSVLVCPRISLRSIRATQRVDAAISVVY